MQKKSLKNSIGILGIDNQHYVGTPYITLNTNIGNIEGIDLLSNDSCLVFDRLQNIWVHTSSPCADALGVCKYNLGKNSGFVILTQLISD